MQQETEKLRSGRIFRTLPTSVDLPTPLGPEMTTALPYRSKVFISKSSA